MGNLIVGCQLLKPVNDPSYVKSGFVLSYLNNEVEMNPIFKERVKNLEIFLNISFKCDEMLHPYDTGNFS